MEQGRPVAVNDLSVGAHKLWVKTGDLKHHSFHDLLIKPYEPSDDIKRLMQWMTGYFSSEAQADTSTDKYHVDVRLRMRRIWPDSTRSFWIYVEQAYAEDTANPYRQRIYRVFEANGQIMKYTKLPVIVFTCMAGRSRKNLQILA